MGATWRRFRQSDLLYHFMRDPVAYISFGILMLLVCSAFAAPLIAPHNPYDPTTIDIMDSEMPPAWETEGSRNFLLGTDDMGRDMLSTMLYGMRISIIIGVGAVCLQALLGIVIGLVSGYIKPLDNILMRVADVQLSFSTYMIAIFIGAIFQMAFGVANYEKIAAGLLILIIGLAEWPQYARTVRASVLAERHKEYVEAARVIGLSKYRIMWRHILPNTAAPLIAFAATQLGWVLLNSAALNFLGLGAPPGAPEWGSMLEAGRGYLRDAPWVSGFPGLTLTLTVLAANLLGDTSLRALRPR